MPTVSGECLTWSRASFCARDIGALLPLRTWFQSSRREQGEPDTQQRQLLLEAIELALRRRRDFRPRARQFIAVRLAHCALQRNTLAIVGHVGSEKRLRHHPLTAEQKGDCYHN
jgi:hypothetical protein